MKTLKICINYDNKTLKFNGSDPIKISKRRIGNSVAFKYAGGHYLAFFECMLKNCYPYERSNTITLKDTVCEKYETRYPLDLNLILPDYLNINGTNTFEFTSEIDNFLLEVEIIDLKESAYRQDLDELLGDKDWEKKNQENKQWYYEEHSIDFESSIETSKPQIVNCVRWEEEKIKKAVCEVDSADIDNTLLPKIVDEECTLGEYINRNCIKQFGRGRICIVNGENGYGKTYSMYSAAQSIIEEDHIVLFIAAYKLKKFEQSIARYILEKYIGNSISDISGREAIKMLLDNLPKGKRVVIMIDGLDELPYRYYRQLIVEDMEVIYNANESVYFIISTRNSNSLIEKGELKLPFTELSLKRINPKEISIKDIVRAQLQAYPLLCTPMIISIFKRMDADNGIDLNKGLIKYGSDTKDISEFKNKTDIFEAWLKMLVSHAEVVGQKGYIYTHFLTYTAYECLSLYLEEDERHDMDRSFFVASSFSDRLYEHGLRESRNFVYPDSTDELIRMFQNTGLMNVVDEGERVLFKNIEYMMFLAAEFKVLEFISSNKKKRGNMIDEMLSSVKRGSNIRFRALPYAFHFFNIVVNKYFSGEIELETIEVSKLMAIGLEIGFERTYDVQENIKKLITWFKTNFDEIRGHNRKANRRLWCSMISNINAVLYNMIIQRHYQKSPKDQGESPCSEAPPIQNG